MCGIAGIVSSETLAPEDRARAEAMRDVIAHRGPDDAGLFVDARAALAHRRLSIVDLAAGHQPLANEDGDVWVVFNGEIYNHRDVRRELEAAGHVYRTHCDTETIVHAYEEWGDRLRRALPRHVRVRDLGRAAAPPAARPRPPGRQAALLGACTATGCSSAPRSRRCSRAACSARRRRRARCPELLGTRYLVGRRHAVQGDPAPDAGAHAGLRSRPCQRAAVLGRTGRTVQPRRRTARGRSGGRPFPGAARRKRADPADGRRAARDVPVGRARQQRDRGAHGRHDRPSAPDLLRRVQAAGLQRARLRAHGVVGDPRGRARDRHRRRRLLRRAAAPDLARRRAGGASLERAALLRVGPRVAPRQGGADRRGQRRTAGRVRQVSAGADQLARGWRVAGRAGRRPRLDRDVGGPAAPGAGRALRRPIVPVDAADAGSDVLRQLRRDRPAPAGRAARRPRSRSRRRPDRPTARRARSSTNRTAAAPRSIACCTRTSRPTSSNCS